MKLYESNLMNYGHEDEVVHESNRLKEINLYGYDVLIMKLKSG